jgi:hypothetical protein
MNQRDGSARRWWQVLFGNWIFHGPDGRNAVSAWVWTLVFGVLLTIGGLPYGLVETGEFRTFSGWRWLLILAPVVPGVIAIVAWRDLAAGPGASCESRHDPFLRCLGFPWRNVVRGPGIERRRMVKLIHRP